MSKKPAKWKDEMIVDVLLYARSGMTKQKIAKALGVTIVTFYKWYRNKSALRYAIKRGRETSKGIETFRDYVYARLPPALQEIWDRINGLEEKKNGVARIEAILKDAGKKARQHLFLYAYTTCGFNASEACRSVNIARQVFEGWYKNDPDFHELFDEMEFHKKNYMEGALMDLIKARDVSAVLFANRTYNADRGYSDKVKVQVEHSGNITHKMEVVSIEDLDLNLELKKGLLQAIRERNEATAQVKKLTHNGNGHDQVSR